LNAVVWILKFGVGTQTKSPTLDLRLPNYCNRWLSTRCCS